MFSQGYLIDSQLCIVALWLFYFTVLHRRIPLGAARIYLLALFPAGMLLPLLRIPLLPAPEIAAPPLMIEMLPMSDIPVVVESALAVDWSSLILLLLYVSGAIVFGAMAAVGILRTWLQIRRTERGRVIFSAEVAGAYSVFGRIVVNNKFEGSPLLGQILAHERSHIVRGHSYDLVWVSLWRCLLWFNPAAWHTGKLLREVHEFQADRSVIRQGHAVGSYIDLLIGTEAGIYPQTANALCYSLTKKRLKMIAKATRGTGVGGYLRLAALPIVGGALLCAFSLTAKAAEPLIIESQPQPIMPTETAPAQPVMDTLNVQVEPITKPEPKVYVDGKKVNPDTIPHYYGTYTPRPETTTRSDKAIITLRGGDSLSRPIYVLDGVIYEPDVFQKKELNPQDYESITVLKGAAATGIYGDRGKSGAIVITTKSMEQRAAELQQHAKALREGYAGISDGSDHLVLTKGIMRINEGQKDQVMAKADYTDESNLQQVNITLTKKEAKEGITISDKLMAEYPDYFYRAQNGSVVNKVPVSVRIRRER